MTGGTPTGMHPNVMGRKRAPGAEFLPRGVLQNHGLLAAPTRSHGGAGCRVRHRRVALHRLRSRGRALLPALRGNTTDVVSCSETFKPARVQRCATCSVTPR